jgi:hypothetical protein
MDRYLIGVRRQRHLKKVFLPFWMPFLGEKNVSLTEKKDV